MINLFKQAWAIFRSNARPLVWVTLIWLLVSLLFAFVTRNIHLQAGWGAPAVNSIIFIAESIIKVVVLTGLLSMILKLVNNQTVEVGDVLKVKLAPMVKIVIGYVVLFSPVLVVNLLVGAGVYYQFASLGLGLIPVLLFSVASVSIVFSLFLSIRFFPFILLILDKNNGPIESLKSAWVITKGDSWTIIKALVLMAVVSVVGAVTVLGTLITLPLSLLIYTLTYKQIVAKELPMVTN